MQGFTPLDHAVLAIYLILVVAMGAAFVKGQRSTEDYFLAGRSMPWLPVGISIFASLFSAISLMGSPGWVYDHDVTLGLTLVTIPLVTPVVVWVILPFFHRLKVFTAYEYLERRFSPPVRLAAGVLFLFQRGSYLAVVIYVPSLVLSTATGIELKWTILMIGGLATFYTLLGGMKAVIWTDVVQVCVLLGGLILVVGVLVSRIEGGVAEIIAVGTQEGPFRVQLSWGDWATVSLGAVLINGIFVNLSQYGPDQITLQRYLTTPDVHSGRNSMLFNAVLTIPVGLILLFIGGALYVFYLKNPARLGNVSTGDAVLPHFVIHELPAGASGVFIAAMFAAAMSTIDSVINSLSTSSMKDFYERHFGRNKSERSPAQRFSLLHCSVGRLRYPARSLHPIFREHLIRFQDLGGAFQRKSPRGLHAGVANRESYRNGSLDRCSGRLRRGRIDRDLDVGELLVVRPGRMRCHLLARLRTELPFSSSKPGAVEGTGRLESRRSGESRRSETRSRTLRG